MGGTCGPTPVARFLAGVPLLSASFALVPVGEYPYAAVGLDGSLASNLALFLPDAPLPSDVMLVLRLLS